MGDVAGTGPTFRSFGGEVALSARSVLAAIAADPAVPAVGAAALARPRTIGVMVASVDGHAAVEGRSGGLGNPADRAIFRGLRERADALLVGVGTLNRERYSTTLDAEHRQVRLDAGLSAEPLLATISRSFSLDEDVPLLHEPLTRAVIYTETAPPFAVDAERIEVARVEEATPAVALADLHARGVRRVNCEGGPTLLAGLVRDGLLDELVLTVSPLLVGTGGALGAPLAILSGDVGAVPRPLELRNLWRSDDVLFLHYHLTHGSSA